MLAPLLSGLVRRLRSRASRLAAFATEQSGVAAVEFAMVLPVMTILFFGLGEVGTAVTIDRKLTLLARSLADLSSRETEMTTASLKSVFDASGAVMRPYDAQKTQMVISSVLVTQVGSNYVGTVAWSCGRNAVASTETDSTKRANNLVIRQIASNYPVPAGYQTSTSKSFILTETLYPYDSPLGVYFKVTRRLRREMPWPARNGDKIAGPTLVNCMIS